MNLLTVDDIANWLQVPKTWIYDRTRDNRIPCVRVGKYVRFDREEIEKWLKESRQRELDILR